MTSLAQASLSQIATDLAKALVRVSSNNQTARISLPLLYPGGSMVGVEFSRIRDGFLVSDGGVARREAGMLGGEKSFVRIAHDVARRFNIRFDHNMMFDLDVPEAHLLPAVIAVAHAAQTAVSDTAMHLAAVEHADYRAYLWEKLDRLYGKSAQKHAKIRGSTEDWEFDAAIHAGSHVTLFEVVSPNANSVNSAVTKFLDVRDLGEGAPKRIAVVTNLNATPRLQVLGRTARILRSDANDNDFRMAA